MNTIVLDSSALLADFEREDGWDTVAELLADVAADRCRLCGCVVNWDQTLSSSVRHPEVAVLSESTSRLVKWTRIEELHFCIG